MVNLLITLVVLILIFGVIFYIVRDLMPLPPAFKNVALLVVGVIFILILLGMVTGAVLPVGDWRLR